MGPLDEVISEQVARWEKHGRGWNVWPHPVPPEPPFCPFLGFRIPRPDVENDDGRKPGLFSSLFESMERALNPKPPVIPEPEDSEPEPDVLERDGSVEFQALLPSDLDLKSDVILDFLSQLAVCEEPIAFEFLGVPGRITAQFVSSQNDAKVLRRQLSGFFPEIAFLPVEHALIDAWIQSQDEALIVEFGLEQEFFLPLATAGKIDPFLGLVNAMGELQEGELALFQVLFQAAENKWKENAMRMISDAQGKGHFINRPEWVEQAEEKFESPLHAAVVRIAVKSADFDRTLKIARELAFSLRIFTKPEGNALIPLHNDEYPPEIHEEDVLLRQSRRSGMLLNTAELMGFVHFPSSAIQSRELLRQVERSKAAPASVTANPVFILGENRHFGKVVSVGLTPDQRVRHTHVIGVSGTGKSNFIFNLIAQDVKNGNGVAVFDPHGDLIEKILGCIPAERIEDVVLLDPSDEEYSVPFNILSAHSTMEKRLIASDLTAVFQRLSTSWGDQMTSVLSNAIMAFLESSQGGTLADMRRFLIEPAYRNQFLKTVNDPNVIYYWQKGFPQLSGNKSIGPLLTRLDMLLAPKPISHMVSQKANRLDFSTIMNGGKIFLAKLSQGIMGQENSSLMGSLLMAKFHLAAIARQNIPEPSRRNFYIYLDEAHNFATPSMVEILTGARKYRVGLILAHQELSQLERVKEIAGAIMGCNTRVVFRVIDSDARKLSEGFSFFEASDLQNLEVGQAICRVERSDHDFNLSIPFPDLLPFNQSESSRQAVIQSSRAKYATPRAEVEASLWQALRAEESTTAQTISPMPKNPEPKTAEVRKPTVSEKEKPVVEAQVESKQVLPTVSVQVEQPIAARGTNAVRGAASPRDLGRGGAQHQAIQKRIKQTAEALGFRAIIEKEVLEGKGSVDLWLERGEIAIACEISISTTIDHEVGNVKKCLSAGVQKVAVICLEEQRLENIRNAVSGSLGAEATLAVEYYNPDQFIAHLKSLPPSPPPGPAAPTVRRGYKIKHSLPKCSSEEQERKEAEAIRSIAEAMQTKLHRKRKQP